jgi:HEAT repeat protein
MRLPRFHIRVRTLSLLVALVALALVGKRVYREGPEAHWILLKLRFGNVEARRSAAARIKQAEGAAMFQGLFPDFFSSTTNPQALPEYWRGRKRRAELFLPVLLRVVKDPDAGCRARALEALAVLAPPNASDSVSSLVLRALLEAIRDKDDSVRTVAVGSLAGLGKDPKPVLKAIRSALADPSVEVRQAAARGLGQLALIVPTSQSDVASILIPLLASREEPRVRVTAAWTLGLFGSDQRRHPAGAGPDVVPALIAALSDPEVDVRRAAITTLGSTSYDARSRVISVWEKRKDSILPYLVTATSDGDKTTRENSALALFAMGNRDPAIIQLIEQVASDPARSQQSKFELALKEWQTERKTSAPVGPDSPEPD